MIVHETHPVTLVGGGHLGPEDLATALSLAPVLVAADGGGAAALQAGHEPRAVIGDMDSLPDWAARRLQDRLHPIPDQETTDFDKALRSIAAPLVIAVGFSGGRMDHTLAALATLAARPEHRCILLGQESLTCLCPPRLVMSLPSQTPVSLFPLAAVTVESAGLVWPTAGLTLAPVGRIGTSNAAVGGPITLVPEGPRLLLILPRDRLRDTAAALRAAPGWL